MSIIDYTLSIQSINIFIYCWIFLFCWFFISTFNITIASVFGFLIGILLIYYINELNNNSINNLNIILKYKLNNLFDSINNTIDNKKIKIPNYLYLDPNLINLLDLIKDFSVYNKKTYVEIVQCINNILYIRYISSNNTLHNIKFLFDIAQNNTYTCLNYMESFIMNLPNEKTYIKKHNITKNKLQLLLKRNLDIIKKNLEEYNKRTGININTRFITNYDFVKPNDTTKNLIGTFNVY